MSYSKHPAHYTVRKGDTVLSVADDFGVPAEKIRQWNRLQGNALRAGKSLTIFKPAAGAVVERTAATSNHRRPATTVSPRPSRNTVLTQRRSQRRQTEHAARQSRPKQAAATKHPGSGAKFERKICQSNRSGNKKPKRTAEFPEKIEPFAHWNPSFRCIANKAELLCSGAGVCMKFKHRACVSQRSGSSRVVPVLSSPRARSGKRYQEET